jgi:hypothetical protein
MTTSSRQRDASVGGSKMKELTLIKTRKIVTSWERLLEGIAIAVLAVLGIFIAHPILMLVNFAVIVLFVIDVIDHTTDRVEKEVTLPVVGGKR